MWYEEFVTSSKIYIEKIANYLKFEHIDIDKIDKEENPDVLIENLNKAMSRAILREEYEVAAKLRDQISSISKHSKII